MLLVLGFLGQWKVQIQLLMIIHLQSCAVVKLPGRLAVAGTGGLEQWFSCERPAHNCSEDKCGWCFCALLIAENPARDFILSENTPFLTILPKNIYHPLSVAMGFSLFKNITVKEILLSKSSAHSVCWY